MKNINKDINNIDYEAIRSGKTAILAEFNRRRMIAEKEGSIVYKPLRMSTKKIKDLK